MPFVIERDDDFEQDPRRPIIGISRVGYPAYPGTGYVSFIVVLVEETHVDSICAYAGAGPEPWVRDHGDKLSYRMACGHFPDLPKVTDEGKKYGDD